MDLEKLLSTLNSSYSLKVENVGSKTKFTVIRNSDYHMWSFLATEEMIKDDEYLVDRVNYAKTKITH